MELKTYIDIIWRRKWLALITILLILAAALLLIKRLPTTYTASAKLRIMTPVSGSSSYVGYDVNYANRLMNTYVALATTALY